MYPVLNDFDFPIAKNIPAEKRICRIRIIRNKFSVLILIILKKTSKKQRKL